MLSITSTVLGLAVMVACSILALLPFIRTIRRGYEQEFRRYLSVHGWRLDNHGVVFPNHMWSGGVENTFARSAQQGVIESDGHTWTLWYGTVQQPGTLLEIPIVALTVGLPSRLSGWVRLRPAHSALNEMKHDADLESIDFNKHFDCRASDARLLPEVFSPDIMARMLDHEPPVSIIVENQKLALTIEGQPNQKKLDELLHDATWLVKVIERSGALEVRTESMLPKTE